MSNLYQELLDNNLSPQIDLQADGYTKYLYLKNTSGASFRIEIQGGVSKPMLVLNNQNPTIKSVAVGTVKVKLAANQGD
ncbi:MAG: hypothetical protein [Bacteriophage sp.]|nr:MAG: hypothetical protein [Bacteriophage sp.]